MNKHTSPPLISVVLTSYNGELYIKNQLISILNQTYKNIEIVICDDHSTDGTMEIIEHFANENENIRYFQNEINLGFNKNFEKAINLANGEYIAISDQDDIWKSDKLEKLIQHIGNNWLIFSNSTFMNSSGRLIHGQLISRMISEKLTFKSILLCNFVTGHTSLFKKSLLFYCFPLPPVKFYDWWMGFVALYHKKIIYLDEFLTYYRIHRQSVIQLQMEAIKNTRKTVDFETILNHLRCFQHYKHLNRKDKSFIKRIRFSILLKNRKFSLFLFIQLFLFQRKWLEPYLIKSTRYNTALYYSKKESC